MKFGIGHFSQSVP